METGLLEKAAKKVVGLKQTRRAVKEGKAKVVFVANDAEPRITERVRQECADANVECLTAESMQALGRHCGIHAGASAAAILKI